MPLQPVSKTPPLPTSTAEDVRRLFERTAAIGRGETTPDLLSVGHVRELAASAPNAEAAQRMTAGALDLYKRGLSDHFFYIGAINPEAFRPLQREAVLLSDTELKAFQLGFGEWLYLLHGASDECVAILAAKLQENPADWQRQWMLAAILTPAALQALADHARADNAIGALEDMGFAIPDSGPAEPRFRLPRQAIQRAPAADVTTARHPIGLPLASVTDGDQPEIVWHYLSLDLSDIPSASGLPFGRLHLVSPQSDCGWSLACRVSRDDRYAVVDVDRDDDDEMYETEDEETAQAILLPFDDRLTYTNGHVFSTPDVCGVIGGPPIGLYPNPKCPDCDKLMLHLCTVESRIRDYGDGFRCLYVCEQCRVATCTGVGWN